MTNDNFKEKEGRCFFIINEGKKTATAAKLDSKQNGN